MLNLHKEKKYNEMRLRKKNHIKKLILIILSVIILSGYSGVQFAFASEVSEAETIGVKELDLGDYAEKMEVGEKQLLSVTVLPLDASDSDISYTSSDTSVASINGMGRITALSAGTTTITVSCGGKSESFFLHVSEAEETTISVTDIEISDYENDIEVGEAMVMSVTVLPVDADDAEVSYSSSDTSVATVNSSGEVKGIAKGNAIIYVSVGSITKEIALQVHVATTMIKLNSNYLVLKPEETFQLNVTVQPAEATQSVSFESLDTSVASVSDKGLVTGKKTGNTTILISNGEIITSVSVIINQNEEQISENKMEEPDYQEVNYEEVFYASEVSVLDSQMLSYFYKNQYLVQVIGDGYVMELDGKKIRNYENKLLTDIQLSEDTQGIHFNLNNGEYMCGEVSLCIDDIDGDYLYLYNDAKEKYELIQTGNLEEVRLTSSGDYLITERKLKDSNVNIKYILLGGGILVAIGISVYIGSKRKYWFW